MDQNKQQQANEIEHQTAFRKEQFSEAVYLMLMSKLPHRVKELAGRFGVFGGEMRTEIIRYVSQLINGDSPVGQLPRWSSSVTRDEFVQEISLMLISADMRQPLKALAERFGIADIKMLVETMMYVNRLTSSDAPGK